jgi:HEAT repeat protein
MAAAAALSGIGDRSIVGILCQSLRSADEDIRRKASRSLVRVFDAEAVEPLCAALKDGIIDVREAAAEALGRIGDSRAVEPLCSVLEDEWIGVRIKALKALEGIADERAVGPLCEVIMDESGFHTVAVRTLGRIGDPRAVNALYLTWERCYQCSFNKNDIQSKEYEAEAREAAEALSKMGRHFEERLLSALRAASLGSHVREGIADLLDSMGAVLNEEDKVWYMIARGSCNELISLGADAVGPLCTVLADSFTGRQAVEALVKIGADSVELLCGILKEKDFELKARAAEALIKLYREGNIEDRCKKKILSQKDIILTLHADISSECGYHEDKGVYRGDMEFLK